MPRVDAGAALPPTIVVTGGKGGVGTTTVAINLAAALAQGGRRTVLVDAAPHADAAQVLGVDVARGACLDDVLTGLTSIGDALRPGPAGIMLLAGRWAAVRSPDRSAKSLRRLLERLPELESHADVLVLDSGSGVTNWTRRLWQHASLVLLVTTPDEVAVMDAYATIKQAIAEDDASGIRVLVNQSSDAATAVEVQSRLAAACRRFLGRTIGRAPRLPRHFADGFAPSAPPLAWEAPASPFGRSVHQLGRFAADVLSQQDRAQHPAPEFVA